MRLKEGKKNDPFWGMPKVKVLKEQPVSAKYGEMLQKAQSTYGDGFFQLVSLLSKGFEIEVVPLAKVISCDAVIFISPFYNQNICCNAILDNKDYKIAKKYCADINLAIKDYVARNEIKINFLDCDNQFNLYFQEVFGVLAIEQGDNNG